MDGIIIAVLSSGALSALIAGLFGLASRRKDRQDAIQNMLEEIDRRLDKMERNQQVSERDRIRTQLLMMIADFPNEKQEIMILAEHYFSKPPEGLGGNWYATGLFNSWLEEHTIARPEWFERRRDHDTSRK